MVIYDVSSLFTNVPIQEAIDAIRDMLQKDETLDERTVLSPDRIVEVLETYLRFTYFSYHGDFYSRVYTRISTHFRSGTFELKR